MFDDEPAQPPPEHAKDPVARAMEKADECRSHAELAAVFEGVRKFDAALRVGLDPDLARDLQRRFAKMERARPADSPVLPEASAADAADTLAVPDARGLGTGDYHIARRPGEVMIVRWLAGDEVDAFYRRLQAHFDTALSGHRDEQAQDQEWKQDPATLAYVAALDAIKVSLADRYLRDVIRAKGIAVLSTQTADEINIAFLCDHVMGVPAADVVGRASAPPADEPTEQDLAWFFKLFLLRGLHAGVEKMCFFTFLQKSGDDF